MLERLKPERPKRPPSKRVKDAQRLAHRGAAAKKEAEEPDWRAKDTLPTEADAASHNKQDRAKTQKEDARGSALPNVFCCAGPGYTAGYWAEPRLTVVAGRNFGSWPWGAARLRHNSFL
jgi:hypothetical protein